MSLRGRVIRRHNVSCYLKPESIQDQVQKFRELGRVFRARFYFNIFGPVTEMPSLLGSRNLWGEFPYPDLITGPLATNCPADSPIWLRIGVPMVFTSNTAISIEPDRGDVHRCVVFVDKSGGVPTLAKMQYLSPLPDANTNPIDFYCNETVVTTDDGKMIVSTTTGNPGVLQAEPCDRTSIAIPSGDIEIYMVFGCTQMDILSGLANETMSYSGPIDVDDWISSVFS